MRLRAVIVAAALVMAIAGPAYADPPSGGGGGDGQNYYAYVKSLVHVRGTGAHGTPSIPNNWDPPHCWYQPEYTYEEMLAWAQRIFFVWHHQGPEDQRDASQWYQETLAQIHQHAGEGGKIFWFLADDGTDAGWACYTSTDPFWIYVGPRPPANPNDKIIDPTELAQIARANLSLPKPRITINPPNGRSFVGLETWVGVQDPRNLFVEAFVPGFPFLHARIDATPSTVRIDVHGADATVHADRATCPVYRKGAAEANACWIRFNRSSLGAPYTITVTRIWQVTTDVPGVALPQGQVAATTTIVIDEIQSNVNG
ncbi:hypothetical protein J5X84_19635 [Streptosporangiaceae bacterium NEAU-GS5]|nr:hypothetical protein [Streptosporangiaceae bacterium NEAU-GS5]